MSQHTYPGIKGALADFEDNLPGIEEGYTVGEEDDAAIAVLKTAYLQQVGGLMLLKRRMLKLAAKSDAGAPFSQDDDALAVAITAGLDSALEIANGIRVLREHTRTAK